MKTPYRFGEREVMVFCVVLLYGFTLLTAKKNDLMKLNVTGNVRALKEQTYNQVQKFGQPAKGAIISQDSLIFNEQGFIIMEEQGAKTPTTYKYDSAGNLSERWLHSNWAIVKYNDNGDTYGYKDSSRITYKYDEKGNMLEMNYFTEYYGNVRKDRPHDNLNFKFMYMYDANGNMTDEKDYDQGGNLFAEYLCKYDAKGNLLEKDVIKGQQITNKTTYKYDDKGLLLEQSEYRLMVGKGLDLDHTNVFKYEYNSEGNWVKKTKTGDVNNVVIISERAYYK